MGSKYELEITAPCGGNNPGPTPPPNPGPPSPPSPNHPPTAHAHKQGKITTGGVLTILFFTVVPVYFVLGFVYMMKVKKAEGMERVPNVSFWRALPGLAREGFRFTWAKITRKGDY